MNETLNKTLHKAIRVEYTVLRAPLTLLDKQVMSRFDEGSKVRTVFERGLGSLDAAAARFVGPTGTQPRAQEVPSAEVEHLAEELLEKQEQEHTLAGELAEDAELRRVQAELKAKHQMEERHEAGH